MWAEPRDVDKSLRVLIVGSDRALEDEFRGALSRVPDRQGTIYFADTHREAVETARRRLPNLIVVEIDRPAGEIAALAKELQAEAPDAAIAGAFVPDRLEQGQSEGATIIELLRAQVRDFVRRPLSTTELRAVLDRLFSRQAVSAAPVAQGRVAAFVSNKGGVGKSTLAVNVACGLALRHPDDVLLVDTSLQVGSCAMLLDLRRPRASSMRFASAIGSIERSFVTSRFATAAGCACSPRRWTRSRASKWTTRRSRGC